MPLDPNHFVDLVNGRFKDTSSAELKAMFANAANSDHLVLHFHGGLVSRKSATAGALGIIDAYKAGGAYPIFFIWNSDLPNTIKGSWKELPSEKAFQRLVRRLVQLAKAKLKDKPGRGGALQLEPMREIPADLEDVAAHADAQEPLLDASNGELTKAELEQIENELSQDTVLREEAAAIALYEQLEQGKDVTRSRSGDIPAVPKPTLMSKGVREDIRQDFFETPGEVRGRGGFLLTLAKHGAEILAKVIYRYVKHRDHGLYTTIVEETMRKLYVDSLGQVAWELMKKDTLDAFDDDETCGGTACLKFIAEWWKPGRRITLVGHSTGALYIGNLLVAADKHLSQYINFEVIFLAAACTFEFMYDRLDVYRRRVDTRIRSFGLSLEGEHGYFEVPLLYQGSLLYMVSGLFEMTEVDKELVGMQRYHDGVNVYTETAVQEVREYLRGKNVWAPGDGTPGHISSAVAHGGFTADVPTQASITHILTNGFA